MHRLMLVIIAAMMLLQAHVSVAQNPHKLRFYEYSGFGGKCTICPVERYQHCYYLAKRTADAASSLYFRNEDYNNEEFSITLYTSETCSGDWFRKSTNIPYKAAYSISSFASKYDNKIQSFKIANFRLPDAEGTMTGSEPWTASCDFSPSC
ncbi:hypothetical protein BX616_001085 [Lobosporangium transversale]|uniref:Uncharacterized protein n=1 Tax=Lobosporangium transversale TaxID=64571 RepID=A0A1Y2GPR2_9FUNG|nr:hypothetical protein BCR41DRAFT_386212 [Lobosporangium transversale]KAF9917416.1 hypothetical protein BX616_001085 [Lobosporangium transversale]ORZ17606.1 hypothetical protein BCR41DRAFT_386212 [Lobosporangium transversale]|eukprot:XP_021881993.1 hypothetical protein BCR41DRAFT_386212 [Lobosporangium transversale]